MRNWEQEASPLLQGNNEKAGLTRPYYFMYSESFVYRNDISQLAEFMMYLASRDAEQMGCGYNAMKSRNTSWVLSRLHFNFLSHPPKDQVLNISTYSQGTDGLFYYRAFNCDSGNERVINACSAWIIIDMDSRMPLKNHIKHFPQIAPDIAMPPKIRIINKDAILLDTIYVDKSHIDINGHVNSINYLKWILNALQVYDISSISMHYKREAFPGQILEIYRPAESQSPLIFLKYKNSGDLAVGARLTV